MFSFVKFLQGFLEKLRKKKGVWFTIVTITALLGIVLSIFVITTMTSSVSKEVYKSMSSDYKLKATNFSNLQLDQFRKTALVLTSNQSILNDLEKNNVSAIVKTETKINNEFSKNGINKYQINLYSASNKTKLLRNSIISVLNSKNTVYGFEVMNDGVFSIYIQPLIKNGKVYGVIEVKESIHNYKVNFESLGDEYVFLLDKKMLSQIGIKAKNQKYSDVINDLILEKSFYDTKFAGTITDIDKSFFTDFMETGYLIDGLYYRTYKVVTDINGVDIGMMVMGELIDEEGGFVNLADDMTKTVTTVALGLVISIILFMF